MVTVLVGVPVIIGTLVSVAVLVRVGVLVGHMGVGVEVGHMGVGVEVGHMGVGVLVGVLVGVEVAVVGPELPLLARAPRRYVETLWYVVRRPAIDEGYSASSRYACFAMLAPAGLCA